MGRVPLEAPSKRLTSMIERVQNRRGTMSGKQGTHKSVPVTRANPRAHKGRPVRIQLEFDAARNTEIERLMELCDVRTKKELFSNALTFLNWGIRNVSSGRKVASISKKGRRNCIELEMPILDAAERNASNGQR